MTGDSADNIPGFPGIGPKTAKKLIKEFDNIDNLITNVNALKGKLKENISNNIAIGKLSKNLVTIDTNVPIDFSVNELKFQKYNNNELIELFENLEFNNLTKKIKNTTPKNEKKEDQLNLFSNKEIIKSNYDNIKTIKKKYTLINNEKEL